MRSAGEAAPAVGAEDVDRRYDRRLFWIAVGIALVPFVVSLIGVLVAAPRTPISDHALEELRVADVGRYPVAIGLFSRDGWAHPGPALYYVLAGPYRLFGTSAAAMMAGALLINAAAVLGMAAIARRLAGSRAAVLLLLMLTLLTRALGADYLRDPWVCYIPVLAFGACCLLVWAAVSGEYWALPAAVAVGSFCAQTHVGYVPLTGGLVVVGFAGAWLDARRRDRGRGLARASLLAVGVGMLLWALPLYDQVFGSGNLGHIVTWFRAAKGGVHTLGEGLRVVGGQFAVVPDWVTGHRRVSLFTGETALRTETLVPALFVLFAAGVVVAVRRRDSVSVRLLAVMSAGLGLGVVAIARTIGPMLDYRLQWLWTLSTLTMFAALLAVGRAVLASRRGLVRPLVAFMLVMLAGVAAVQSVAAARMNVAYGYGSDEVGEVADQLQQELRPDGGQIVVRSSDPAAVWYREGLVMALERRGLDARVPGDVASTYGRHRVRSPGPVQAELDVLSGKGFTEWRPGGEWEQAAYAGDADLAVMQERVIRNDRAQADLVAALVRGDIDLATYNQRRRALDRNPPRAVLVTARRP